MSGIIGGAGSKSGVIGTTELDYEEGEWTPVNYNWTTFALGTPTSKYIKIGSVVTVWINTTSNSVGTGGQYFTGLPYAPTHTTPCIFTDGSPTKFIGGIAWAGTPNVSLVESWSSDNFMFTCTYHTTG